MKIVGDGGMEVGDRWCSVSGLMSCLEGCTLPRRDSESLSPSGLSTMPSLSGPSASMTTSSGGVSRAVCGCTTTERGGCAGVGKVSFIEILSTL